MASEGQDKYMQLTPEQQQGTRGWKQGNMYRYIYPPYREEDMINTPIPIEGVQVSDSVKEAYSGLKLQSPVRHRMGIFDISVSTDGDVEVVENEFSFNKREKPESEVTETKSETKPIGETDYGIPKLPQPSMKVDAYGLPVKKEATFNINVPPKPQNQGTEKPKKPLGKDWYLHDVEAPESLRSFGL